MLINAQGNSMINHGHLVHFCSSIRSQSITVAFFAVLCGILYCQPNEAFTSELKAKSIVIIGNKELPFDSLSRNELADIFRCRKTRWDGNQQIEVAILKGSKIHQNFGRYGIRKTSTEYQKYRKNNLVASGDCSSITFKSEKSVLSHVALTRGAIGCISSYTKPVGVKVLKISDTKQ